MSISSLSCCFRWIIFFVSFHFIGIYFLFGQLLMSIDFAELVGKE